MLLEYCRAMARQPRASRGTALGRLSWTTPDYCGEKSFTFFINGEDVGMNFFERPEWLWPVEMAIEADLVTYLRLGLVDPFILGIWEDLAPNERLDATDFLQRHLLGVSQITIGLVFHHARSTADRHSKSSVQ